MGWDEECEKPESQQTEEKRGLPFFENLRENSLYLEFYVLNLGLMTSWQLHKHPCLDTFLLAQWMSSGISSLTPGILDLIFL